jgi:hypothetical protein
MKGTSFVLDAFERLKKEGVEFTPLLIEGMSNQEMLQKLGDVDILIDQLILPGGGKLATEGLASGCVVMSKMGYGRYSENNIPGCPIIDVNPENIYTELKKIITDHERRNALSREGRPYTEKHLNYRVFCEKIVDLVDGKSIAYDYVPSFFREEFIPESEEARVCYNTWTKTVSECDWYKEYISKGERTGLIF